MMKMSTKTKGEKIMSEENGNTREPTIEELANDAREELKQIEKRLRDSLTHPCYYGEDKYPNQTSEMKAHTMLVVRHIEDARKHCGEILQHAGDGASVYDKT